MRHLVTLFRDAFSVHFIPCELVIPPSLWYGVETSLGDREGQMGPWRDSHVDTIGAGGGGCGFDGGGATGPCAGAAVCGRCERVSSTRVREALGRGEMATAAKLLGRDYRMSGRVARGEQLGRQLGFPTANIHLHRQAIPVGGVFAARATRADT